MRTLFLLLAFTVAHMAGLKAQIPQITIQVDEGANPWNHLNVNDKPGQFQFAIVTDRTGGHRPGVFEDGVRKLNLLQPEFVMSVGDLIEGYTEDLAELNQQWDEFEGFIEQLEMPFFYVPGNHDYTNSVMAQLWEQRLGKSYYHFVYQDVLFLCLNSEEPKKEDGPSTQMLDPQFEYVKGVLEDHPDVKWTLLFIHKPMWVYGNTVRWPDLEKLLANRNHTVFAGHQHHYVKYDRNNGKYIMLATTGGGSGLRGPALGEFDHVVWVTMTEEGPVLANLLLEGIWDENVMTNEQYDVVGPLRRQSPLRIDPLLVSDSRFTQGLSQLRITNDSDLPMRTHLAFSSSEDLQTNVGLWEKVLEPNSVELVDLKLSTETAMSISDIQALELKGSYTFMPEKYPEVTLTSEHLVQPILPHVIENSPQAVNIDGRLSDWEELKIQVDDSHIEADAFSHQGTADVALSFDVKADQKYLYIAARVKDDEMLIDTTKEIWDQDALMIQIDGRKLTASANATSNREGLTFLQTPNPNSEGQSRIYRKDRLPEGVKYACKKALDTNFYVAEVAIPVSLLNTWQGGDWEYVRINVGVLDYDKDYAHETRMYWQPDWGQKPYVIGSGTFRKSPVPGSTRRK